MSEEENVDGASHTHMVISISLHPEKKLISYFRGAAAENET